MTDVIYTDPAERDAAAAVRQAKGLIAAALSLCEHAATRANSEARITEAHALRAFQRDHQHLCEDAHAGVDRAVALAQERFQTLVRDRQGFGNRGAIDADTLADLGGLWSAMHPDFVRELHDAVDRLDLPSISRDEVTRRGKAAAAAISDAKAAARSAATAQQVAADARTELDLGGHRTLDELVDVATNAAEAAEAARDEALAAAARARAELLNPNETEAR